MCYFYWLTGPYFKNVPRICLWKLAVAVATYVSICIVYRILPSCLLLLSNGIDVDIGHTCNTMRVRHS
jgi:hypothetical protein